MRHDAHGRVLTTFGLDTFHRRIAALYRDALGTAPRPAAAQARVENQES
jgi:hypothetical protein